MRALKKRIRAQVARLDGVARLGGARRWWLLGFHGPGVRVREDREGRLRFEVRVITFPGANVIALGRHIQDLVAANAGDRSEAAVEAVDVYLNPRG